MPSPLKTNVPESSEHLVSDARQRRDFAELWFFERTFKNGRECISVYVIFALAVHVARQYVKSCTCIWDGATIPNTGALPSWWYQGLQKETDMTRQCCAFYAQLFYPVGLFKCLPNKLVQLPRCLAGKRVQVGKLLCGNTVSQAQVKSLVLYETFSYK